MLKWSEKVNFEIYYFVIITIIINIQTNLVYPNPITLTKMQNKHLDIILILVDYGSNV